MDSKLFSAIDDQVSVQFTGKVNVLSNFNRQFLGHILFRNGRIVDALFQGQRGEKALYHIFIQEFSLQSYEYVVEPEVVDETILELPYSHQELKEKMAEALKQYQQTQKMRPPENVKIIIDPEFIEDSLPVTTAEFEVLCALTEWHTPFDIYQHCPLLDHEITTALVGLRKKNALKILAPKNNP
jgi:hypothetical protein